MPNIDETEPQPPTPIPIHAFIERLIGQVRDGYGLVPFLGSGCSAGAGIMMGEQFTDYLACTVWRCVVGTVLPERRRRHEDLPNHWDLRKSGWPPQPNDAEVHAAREWAYRQYEKLAKQCGVEIVPAPGYRIAKIFLAPDFLWTPDAFATLLHAPLVPPFLRDGNTSEGLTDGAALRHLHELRGGRGKVDGGLVRAGISPTAADAIVERAIRSLYDWRATLHFLSELRLVGGKRLTLVEPDPAIVDGFNVHITRNRRPSLIHTMLAHLREPARMRLFLTTNFDTLIEDAFVQESRRIEVISVSVRGELPDPDIVHARDTVVKIHGTLSETRADFSLDDLPSLNDRRRFFDYVRGAPPEDAHGNRDAPNGRFIPGQLLVAGYSGSDARCIQLIKYVLDGDEGAVLFWVCHNERDHARLGKLFSEETYRDRIVVTIADRFDLLLYEFQQKLCLSLPPGGFVFPGSYQIKQNAPPEARFRPEPEDDARITEGAGKILEKLAWLDAEPGQAGPQVATPTASERGPRPHLVVVDGPSGVSKSMAVALRRLTRSGRRHGVWLELEDFTDATTVAHELFQTIAIRRGVFQLRHAQLCPHKPPEDIEGRLGAWIDHIALLKSHLGIEPSQWVVALYGRNGPGGCTGWEESVYWGDKGSAAGAVPYEQLEVLLAAFICAGFVVLYAPYSRRRKQIDNDRPARIKNVLARQRESGRTWQQAWRNAVKNRPDKDGRAHPFINLPHIHDDNSLRHSLAKLLRSTDVEDPDGEVAWVDCPRQPPGYPRQGSYDNTMVRVLYEVNGGDPDLARKRTKDSPRESEEEKRTENVEVIMQSPATQEVRSLRWRHDFVYGASLFRQSRHYTAFLNEGILRSPEPFNEHGVDNDWIRYHQLEQILQDFNTENLQVFYRKPGGFAWTYRDVRLGIRLLVEVASKATERRFAKQTNSAGAQARKAEERLIPCEARRSRSHFWIGHWYLRAYYVSKHATPLMEAAYHFYQCAIHAPDAENPVGKEVGISPAQYKLQWWLLGINQLTKTLRIGERAIQFWFDRKQCEAWFSDAREKDVIDRVGAAYTEINASVDRRTAANFVDIVHSLRAIFKHLQRWLCERPRIYDYRSIEGTWTRRGVEKKSPRDLFKTPPELEETSLTGTNPGYSLVDRRLDPGRRGAAQWWTPCLKQGSPLHLLMTETSANTAAGRSPFRRRLLMAVELSGVGITTSGRARPFSPDPAQALATLQDFVEWTYALLIRAKREDYGLRWAQVPLAEEKDGSTEKPSPRAIELTVVCIPRATRQQWVRVCMFARAAEDAWHWLPPGLESFATAEASKAIAMQGLALAHLGQFHEAHGRFNHAHALIGESRSNHGVALGILELRRAEAYLLEANLAQQLAEILRVTRGETRHTAEMDRKSQEADAGKRHADDRQAGRQRKSGGARRVRRGNGPKSEGARGPANPRQELLNDLRKALPDESKDVDPPRLFMDCLHKQAAEKPTPRGGRTKQDVYGVGIRWPAGRDAGAPSAGAKLGSDVAKVVEDYMPEERVKALWMWLHARVGASMTDTAPTEWSAVDARIHRLSQAWCDDAWGCLERAESLLGGHTRSPTWWCRLRALQLYAYATPVPKSLDHDGLRYRPLTNRVRHDLPSTLRFLWDEGIVAAPNNAYRRLRVLDYYTRALVANRVLPSPEDAKALEDECATLGKMIAREWEARRDEVAPQRARKFDPRKVDSRLFSALGEDDLTAAYFDKVNARIHAWVLCELPARKGEASRRRATG